MIARSNSAKQRKSSITRGFSRLDLIAALTTLLLVGAVVTPAILQARTRAREHVSVDHLRQIGDGLSAHVDTYGFLPSNGGPSAEAVTSPNARTINPNDEPYQWGYGDPRRAGRQQPGCWAFAILPYIGHEQDFLRRNQAVAVEAYYIPGRRPAKAEPAIDSDPIYAGWGCLPDGVNPWGKTDYAANDQLMRGGVGRVMRLDEIRDGLAVSILVGEKAMDSRAVGKGGWYWDEPLILGGSGGTGRKGNRLLRDGPIHEDAADNWGSPNEHGVSFLFADNSVRTMSYRLDPVVLRSLIYQKDGKPLPERWWETEAPTK